MKATCLLAVACAICMALFSMPANAQARTWVSGVGDDANPCSRTAPCKTFAGAISKTTTAGEINCLDPGGFGALTITKSIAIICKSGEAGVLVSGTNGINVNAAGGVVYLEGLDFEGLGSGLTGISFINGTSLYVKDCTIRGFVTTGITFAPSAGNTFLTVDNTVVTDQAGGGGILIAPTGGVANAQITNTRMVHNVYGLRVQDNGKAMVNNSVASNNSNNGILAASTAAAAEINITHSVTASNGTNGIATSGANALIRIDNVSILDNATGINTGAGGTVTSFSPATNANAGNGTPGAPNGSAIPLQ
jgi:hypothetical protein